MTSLFLIEFNTIEVVRSATLQQPEKNQALFRIPKQVIKTFLTDDNDNVSDSQDDTFENNLLEQQTPLVQFRFLWNK